MGTLRRAGTVWNGPYHGGLAEVSLASSGLGPFEVGPALSDVPPMGKTSPMELLAAAEASCVSGMLAFLLEKAGHSADRLEVSAEVELEGASVVSVRISLRGTVPGLTAEQFTALAERAKSTCPVSKALSGTEISVNTELAQQLS